MLIVMACSMLVTQSCLTLCNPIDCSLPDYGVHGILQARVLEWAAIPFFRGSSKPRNQTQISHIAGRYFYQLNHQGNLIGIELLNSSWVTQINYYVFTVPKHQT